ncbi:MAG: LacI family DNA-binding transcriptional regulator [Sphingomonadales bacterium]|nr:LacI family DNA-binding transcriptional regulator [Sphingomonadales bacterium]
MSEVASAAGVSAMTVSRVLRTPDKVSRETSERVEAAIRQLGYVRDEAAGALASRRSRIVGALVSTLGGSVFASTVDGLSQTLREAGYQLLLATTNYTPQIEADVIAAILARRPDGLVLTSTEHTAAANNLLRGAGIPIVELWELPKKPIDSAVGFSNRAAGRAMTEFLAASGRRRIGFIGRSAVSDTRGQMRRAGYEDALAQLRRAPRIATPDGLGMDDPRAGAVGLAEILAQWKDTDAVFCASDSVALGALSEARRRGIAVPHDVAIAGFGDFEMASEHGLGLTTVRVPGFSIGAEAAQVVLRRGEAKAPGKRVIDLGFEIVRRMTA